MRNLTCQQVRGRTGSQIIEESLSLSVEKSPAAGGPQWSAILGVSLVAYDHGQENKEGEQEK